METVSGEITLHDLIAWEPRLRLVSPLPGSSHFRSPATVEVDWILTARSTQPILPAIRGGELIVLSDRIVRDIGVPFAALMREISSQPIAGILTDHPGPPDASTGIAVLHIPVVDSETERDLNRLLTNGRRDALQRIAELDQIIAEAGARQSRPGELIDALARLLQVPVIVQTPGETTLFTTGTSREIPEAASDAWLRASLRNGYSVWLGPVEPARHALARFAIGHVRDALQRALDSSLSTLPRGTARAEALNRLLREPLTADPKVLAQEAMAAGIPPDRILRVAYSSASLHETQVRRSLQNHGDILDAGDHEGHRLWLLASRASLPAPGRIGKLEDGWIALSGATDTAGQIPQLTRQATFVATLLAGGLIPGSVAAFDNPAALGIYGLLYGEWGMDSQIAYRDQHLGALRENDPRGLLVHTLGVFLDQGGSQRLTAEHLGIHRNTLTYRLRQINAALPVDFSDPHIRLTLHVAVAIDRILPL